MNPRCKPSANETLSGEPRCAIWQIAQIEERRSHRRRGRKPLNEEILLESDVFLCQLRADAEVRVLIITRSESTCCAGGASVALSYYRWFVPR